MLTTYGRLMLEPGKGNRWIVDNLVPHVALAFKRLFPRVAPEDTKFAISDNDEVRADLLWFMQRYPLETKHLAMLRAGDRALKERAAERGRILMPTWVPGETKGWKEGKKPYLYQSQAATIAVAQGGLLLADEVGLGKTVSAFAALLGGAPMPAAIVVQPHLAIQWATKAEEFTDLTVHTIYTRTPYALPPADVYIFAYTNIAGWVDYLKNGLIKSVIYDEIQELRTGTETAKGKAAAIVSAQARFRMGLTATATYNYGDEIHTIMEYIRPDILGDRDEFTREWCGYGRIVKDPDALGAYLKESGWMLRRTEDDEVVDRSMPSTNVVSLKVAWDDDAAADDAALTRALAMSVMSGSFMQAGRAARELDAKMRHMTGVAKARSVAAYVRLLLQDAPRVVLGGWHRDVYAVWMSLLADFKPELYTGSEDRIQKNRALTRFTTGSSRVLILSLRSGAGIDGLQHYCNDAVIGELDWSPQVHHQFVGRLRRPGQVNQVNAHYLYADEGSDPVLVETLGIKSDQARGIHDPGVIQRARVSDDSRIKRLAQFVLDQGDVEAPACALCDDPSNGKPTNILPLADALKHPPGPMREAYYGADNIWFLCDPCADARA